MLTFNPLETVELYRIGAGLLVDLFLFIRWIMNENYSKFHWYFFYLALCTKIVLKYKWKAKPLLVHYLAHLGARAPERRITPAGFVDLFDYLCITLAIFYDNDALEPGCVHLQQLTSVATQAVDESLRSTVFHFVPSFTCCLSSFVEQTDYHAPIQAIAVPAASVLGL